MSTTLEPFHDRAWTVFHPLKLAGIALGTRATILKLPSGGLTIISPVPFHDDLASQIDALGPVENIIAPNLFHHFYFNAACERWPQARALVPRGLKKKVSIIDRASELSPSGAIDDTLFWHRLEGTPLAGEHLFVYPDIETLVITDLAFNFHQHPQLWLRITMTLNGVYNTFGCSRLFRSTIKDKKAFGSSLLPLLDYPWDSIILPHGDLIPHGARALFEETFRPFIPAS